MTLKSVEQPTQRRRAMSETALQVADRVLSAVSEQCKDVSLSLRDARVGKECLEFHACGVGRALQRDNHERRGILCRGAEALLSSVGFNHELKVLRNGIVRDAS